MKKFSNNLFWLVVVLILVLATIISIVASIGGLETIKAIGGGSLILGFLKLPLCLFGGFQIVRGFYSVVGKDTEVIVESFGGNKSRQIAWAIYIFSTIAGYIFFVDLYSLIT